MRLQASVSVIFDNRPWCEVGLPPLAPLTDEEGIGGPLAGAQASRRGLLAARVAVSRVALSPYHTVGDAICRKHEPPEEGLLVCGWLLPNGGGGLRGTFRTTYTVGLDRFSQGHCARRTFPSQERASNPSVHIWQWTGIHTLLGTWADIMRPITFTLKSCVLSARW